MAGSPEGNPKLGDLAGSDGISGYVRLKAVEALGRLRASAANEILQKILEARQVWRWQYPSELRIAAGQALLRIDPVVALSKISAAGFDKKDMVLEPIDPEPNSSVIRQRRYARLKLRRNLTLVTTNIRENFRLSVPEMNLGGGIGAGERHLAPGTLVTLKLTQGVRAIKAQAIVRGARPQAMAFEFVEMDLEDRARLRKILLELGGLPQAANVASRTRRRGRLKDSDPADAGYRGLMQTALEPAIPMAFALAREAGRRFLNMRHFDVQLIGGLVLHDGKIAEMKTGEGKTLVATLPAVLNSLAGSGVHIVTVNDYLARRDAEWMSPLYRGLGLSVGVIVNDLDDPQRQAAYGADITYGTNNEYGFDYLRDNMKYDIAQCVQRGHHFAIVDEVDSILIDEARTPLIISGPSEESTDKYYRIDKIIRKLIQAMDYI